MKGFARDCTKYAVGCNCDLLQHDTSSKSGIINNRGCDGYFEGIQIYTISKSTLANTSDTSWQFYRGELFALLKGFISNDLEYTVLRKRYFFQLLASIKSIIIDIG